MQVQRVCLNTVQLAIRSNLGLSLIEIRLGPRLAVELLNVICRRVEQIAMVRLLIRCCEPTKDQDVFV